MDTFFKTRCPHSAPVCHVTDPGHGLPLHSIPTHRGDTVTFGFNLTIRDLHLRPRYFLSCPLLLSKARQHRPLYITTSGMSWACFNNTPVHPTVITFRFGFWQIPFTVTDQVFLTNWMKRGVMNLHALSNRC